MCRFAKRCENFYPDSDSPTNCLLICQKNPLSLSLALMPDRYIEKDFRFKDPDKTVVSMDKEVEPRNRSKNDRLQEDYDELVSVTQDLENETIDFDPTIDIASKAKANTVDLSDLITRSDKRRNSTEMSADVTKAIVDSVTDDGEGTVMHPLDDINFEPVERIAVADQPDEPDNPKVYVKTRERGRPKMSEEEKEESRIRREGEKIEEDERKQQEAIDGRNRMKEKIRKKKKKKNKK